MRTNNGIGFFESAILLVTPRTFFRAKLNVISTEAIDFISSATETDAFTRDRHVETQVCAKGENSK